MSENPFSLVGLTCPSPAIRPLLWADRDAGLDLCLRGCGSRCNTASASALPIPCLHSMWIIGAFLLLTGTLVHDLFRAARNCVHFPAFGPAHCWRWRCRCNEKPQGRPPRRFLAAWPWFALGWSVPSPRSSPWVVLAEVAGLPARRGAVAGRRNPSTAGVAMGISEIHARRSVADRGPSGSF